MSDYIRRVFWSDEDACYIATAPAFPHLSAWGETETGALQEMDTVLTMAIEIYREHGWELPPPDAP